MTRNEAIKNLYAALTAQGEAHSDVLTTLAERHDLTPERIKQIVGVTSKEAKRRAKLSEKTACPAISGQAQKADIVAYSETVNNNIDSDSPLEILPANLPASAEALTSEDYEIKAPEQKPAPPPTENNHHQLSGKMERWLFLPDIHVPVHDKRTMKAVLEYASTIHWDGVCQLGDLMDWDFCSRWTKENQRAVEGRRFLEEYVAGNEFLDELTAAARNKNPDAKIVILEGNHDIRPENVIDKTPALQGLIEMDHNLRFAERNITWWRYWTHKKPYIIGKLWIIHGHYIGANHVKKTADNFHRNVLHGHTHDVMSYVKTTVAQDSVQCQSLGTLSELNLPYIGHAPSNWSQAFGEAWFNPDGTFNLYVTNIYDHRFVATNGEVYQG